MYNFTKFHESSKISIYASLSEMKGAINMAFLAYKANECFNHQYIKIPKDLFINPLYKHLNSDSKIIYGFLLDRLSLSIKHNWIDKETGNVYLIFTRKKIQ